VSNFEEKSNMKTKLIVLTIAVLALGTLKSFAQTTTADVNIIIDIPENGKENNHKCSQSVLWPYSDDIPGFKYN
jgi:hypothetical protein